MTRNTYAVSGMSCGHCAASVRDELGELPGVQTVDVDVPTGRVVVTSAHALAVEHVEDAVRTAGYRLVR